MNIFLFKEYILLEVDYMKLLKSLGFGLGIFLILNLIITIFSYFDLFTENIINIFKVIVFIITFVISGIYLGINVKKKSLLNGSKLSLLYILISTLFILLLPNLEFSFKILLYYLLIGITINIGTFIGVNKRRFK